MFPISRNAPCFSITSVEYDRLPAFRTDALKQIVCPPSIKQTKMIARRGTASPGKKGEEGGGQMERPSLSTEQAAKPKS